MFKSVEIKRTDTCLTFVLKRLGILGYHKNLDGIEFIKKFNLIEITNFDSLNKGDIIVLESKKHYFKKRNLRIDEQGRTFSDYQDNSYHFMLFEGDAISDFGNNGIGYYNLNYFNIENAKSKYSVIRYSDLS